MEKEPTKKIDWYWGLVFPVTCFALFYTAIFPSYYYFPEVLTKSSETNHVGKFIGERAEETLLELSSIGVKVVGSREHQIAIEYLYRKVENIRNNSRLDLYDIEIDKQIVSGNFKGKGNNFKFYQDLTNIVVKVRPVNVKNENALLVNSHFDSEVGSPAAGDAGVMIAIMVETFRVIALDEKPLDHTVIFLLNGSEENGLLASHGFISSHKWAKDVRAVINLDSAGNGGREILFQSGPNHPWLMSYYRKSVAYPFASTIGEELFQNNFIPSDTDFRIFRDFGIPGLDLAHSYNGYVYHTKYDRFSVLTRGTYQLTGTNILGLTRSLANAPELDDTKAHEEGHTVFYDMAGWFMVFYTETTGIIINWIVAVVGVALIGVFTYLTQKDTQVTYKDIGKTFGLILVVQVLSFVLAFVANLIIALLVDAMGLSISWYSNLWILFGLYFCPFFFVLGIGQSVLFSLKFMKNHNLPLNTTTQMMMHSQCIIMILLLIVITSLGIRSSFVVMVAVFFYAISVLINMVISRFYSIGIWWTLTHCLCQLLPFWFYTYLCYAILVTFIPMQGRNGTVTNSDITISFLTAFFAYLFSGFLIPLFNMFRKPKLLFSSFGVLTIVFIIIAATPAGFPFKAETAPQRYTVRHTNRAFYDFNGNITRQDSGYALYPWDRRYSSIEKYIPDFEKRLNMKDECASELFCGLPIYRHLSTANNHFIPGPMAVLPDEKLSVKLVSRETIGNRRKFQIELTGSDHTTVLLNFGNGTTLVDWSVGPDAKNVTVGPPFMFTTYYGLDRKSFTFNMELERDGSEDSPTLEMAAVAHYVHHESMHTDAFKEFLKAFPEWSHVDHWVSDYQNYKF